MNDLIDRQAAIEAIRKLPNAGMHWFVSAEAVFDVLLKLPSAQHWIPYSERFPEAEKKTYWICTNTGYQCECRWTNNVYGLGESGRWGWSVFDIPQYTEVVAWMPLPEPYKEGSREKV